MKKLLKILLGVLLCVVVTAALGIGWLTATEYRPEPAETAGVEGSAEKLDAVSEIRILTWNIGYAGLGEGSDFFMDGGKNVKSADRATVEKYISGISDFVRGSGADVVLLQEVDRASSRTYDIDETEFFDGVKVYAPNFLCKFVPYPVPPIGRVDSGLLTVSQNEIDSAQRLALHCPFDWPVRIANLKRCLLVSYLPIEGSDRQLVLVNCHLEAYDSGEGKLAQTKQLREFIESEYRKGNYVITGGDFNQCFPGALEAYPNTHEELWLPGELDDDLLPEGFEFKYDLSVPTCRLLNQPYDESDEVNTQHYVIDGFIVSPNVEAVSVETVDLGFENSDHNPVMLTVTLK